MPHSDFIAEWFPFTVSEIRIAFLAMDETGSDLDHIVTAFAAEIRSMSDENGMGFFEMGDFLGPIAELSPEAARRVAEFRATWGGPKGGPSLV